MLSDFPLEVEAFGGIEFIVGDSPEYLSDQTTGVGN